MSSAVKPEQPASDAVGSTKRRRKSSPEPNGDAGDGGGGSDSDTNGDSSTAAAAGAANGADPTETPAGERTSVACLPCSRSKVRCSYGIPCTRCVKRGTQSECLRRVHRPPGPAPKRARKTPTTQTRDEVTLSKFNRRKPVAAAVATADVLGGVLIPNSAAAAAAAAGPKDDATDSDAATAAAGTDSDRKSAPATGNGNGSAHANGNKRSTSTSTAAATGTGGAATSIPVRGRKPSTAAAATSSKPKRSSSTATTAAAAASTGAASASAAAANAAAVTANPLGIPLTDDTAAAAIAAATAAANPLATLASAAGGSSVSSVRGGIASMFQYHPHILNAHLNPSAQSLPQSILPPGAFAALLASGGVLPAPALPLTTAAAAASVAPNLGLTPQLTILADGSLGITCGGRVFDMTRLDDSQAAVALTIAIAANPSAYMQFLSSPNLSQPTNNASTAAAAAAAVASLPPLPPQQQPSGRSIPLAGLLQSVWPPPPSSVLGTGSSSSGAGGGFGRLPTGFTPRTNVRKLDHATTPQQFGTPPIAYPKTPTPAPTPGGTTTGGAAGTSSTAAAAATAAAGGSANGYGDRELLDLGSLEIDFDWAASNTFPLTPRLDIGGTSGSTAAGDRATPSGSLAVPNTPGVALSPLSFESLNQPPPVGAGGEAAIGLTTTPATTTRTITAAILANGSLPAAAATAAASSTAGVPFGPVPPPPSPAKPQPEAAARHPTLPGAAAIFGGITNSMPGYDYSAALTRLNAAAEKPLTTSSAAGGTSTALVRQPQYLSDALSKGFVEKMDADRRAGIERRSGRVWLSPVVLAFYLRFYDDMMSKILAPQHYSFVRARYMTSVATPILEHMRALPELKIVWTAQPAAPDSVWYNLPVPVIRHVPAFPTTPVGANGSKELHYLVCLNRAAEELTGYTTQEYIDLFNGAPACFKILHPNDWRAQMGFEMRSFELVQRYHTPQSIWAKPPAPAVVVPTTTTPPQPSASAPASGGVATPSVSAMTAAAAAGSVDSPAPTANPNPYESTGAFAAAFASSMAGGAPGVAASAPNAAAAAAALATPAPNATSEIDKESAYENPFDPRLGGAYTNLIIAEQKVAVRFAKPGGTEKVSRVRLVHKSGRLIDAVLTSRLSYVGVDGHAALPSTENCFSVLLPELSGVSAVAPGGVGGMAPGMATSIPNIPSVNTPPPPPFPSAGGLPQNSGVTITVAGSTPSSGSSGSSPNQSPPAAAAGAAGAGSLPSVSTPVLTK